MSEPDLTGELAYSGSLKRSRSLRKSYSNTELNCSPDGDDGEDKVIRRRPTSTERQNSSSDQVVRVSYTDPSCVYDPDTLEYRLSSANVADVGIRGMSRSSSVSSLGRNSLGRKRKALLRDYEDYTKDKPESTEVTDESLEFGKLMLGKDYVGQDNLLYMMDAEELEMLKLELMMRREKEDMIKELREDYRKHGQRLKEIMLEKAGKSTGGKSAGSKPLSQQGAPASPVQQHRPGTYSQTGITTDNILNALLMNNIRGPNEKHAVYGRQEGDEYRVPSSPARKRANVKPTLPHRGRGAGPPPYRERGRGRGVPGQQSPAGQRPGQRPQPRPRQNTPGHGRTHQHGDRSKSPRKPGTEKTVDGEERITQQTEFPADRTLERDLDGKSKGKAKIDKEGISPMIIDSKEDINGEDTPSKKIDKGKGKSTKISAEVRKISAADQEVKIMSYTDEMIKIHEEEERRKAARIAAERDELIKIHMEEQKKKEEDIAKLLKDLEKPLVQNKTSGGNFMLPPVAKTLTLETVEVSTINLPEKSVAPTGIIISDDSDDESMILGEGEDLRTAISGGVKKDNKATPQGKGVGRPIRPAAKNGAAVETTFGVEEVGSDELTPGVRGGNRWKQSTPKDGADPNLTFASVDTNNESTTFMSPTMTTFDDTKWESSQSNMEATLTPAGKEGNQGGDDVTVTALTRDNLLNAMLTESDRSVYGYEGDQFKQTPDFSKRPNRARDAVIGNIVHDQMIADQTPPIQRRPQQLPPQEYYADSGSDTKSGKTPKSKKKDKKGKISMREFFGLKPKQKKNPELIEQHFTELQKRRQKYFGVDKDTKEQPSVQPYVVGGDEYHQQIRAGNVRTRSQSKRDEAAFIDQYIKENIGKPKPKPRGGRHVDLDKNISTESGGSSLSNGESRKMSTENNNLETKGKETSIDDGYSNASDVMSAMFSKSIQRPVPRGRKKTTETSIDDAAIEPYGTSDERKETDIDAYASSESRRETEIEPYGTSETLQRYSSEAAEEKSQGSYNPVYATVNKERKLKGEETSELITSTTTTTTKKTIITTEYLNGEQVGDKQYQTTTTVERSEDEEKDERYRDEIERENPFREAFLNPEQPFRIARDSESGNDSDIEKKPIEDEDSGSSLMYSEGEFDDVSTTYSINWETQVADPDEVFDDSALNNLDTSFDDVLEQRDFRRTEIFQMLLEETALETKIKKLEEKERRKNERAARRDGGEDDVSDDSDSEVSSVQHLDIETFDDDMIALLEKKIELYFELQKRTRMDILKRKLMNREGGMSRKFGSEEMLNLIAMTDRELHGVFRDTEEDGDRSFEFKTPKPEVVPPTDRRSVLYVNADVFEQLDTQVIEIAQLEEKTYVQLVRDLTRKCTDELEKARALFRWITVKDLNKIRFRENCPNPNTLMGMLKGIKEGTASYHELYRRLCGYAGLHCEVIEGYSKGVGYRPGMKIACPQFKNSWTAVSINGQWRFVNCNWGARHLKNKDSTTTQVSVMHYKCDEFYFCTDPEDHIYQHYPDDVKWQLLKHPVTVSQFMRLPVLKSPFINTGLKLRTRVEERLYTKNGQVEFVFRMTRFVGLYCTLELITPSGPVLEGDGHIMIRVIDDEAVFNIFPPDIGRFYLNVYVSEDWKSTSLEHACAFQVIAADDCYNNVETNPYGIFPNVGVLGRSPILDDLGMTIPKDQDPFISVRKDKEVVLPFKLTRDLKLSHQMKLFNRKGEYQGDYDEFVFLKYTKGKKAYYVRCPEKGYFVLSIFAAPARGKTSSAALECVLRYLVDCRAPIKDAVPFPKPSRYWRGCELLEPTNGQLYVDTRVNFGVIVPDAIEVAVVVGKSGWQNLEFSETTADLWEGVMSTGHDVGAIVSIFARYDLKQEKFSPLLEYTVVEKPKIDSDV